MLSELLTEKTIEVNVKVKDWREAVERAGRLMVRINAVELRYIDAMVKLVEDVGPYIVITQGVAIPHARPEDGAKSVSISLITLENPVSFGNLDNDPVYIVIAFAGVDNKSHLEMLVELMGLLEKPENLKRIREAKVKEDILQLL